jgi:hypothetical protein
MPGSALRLLNQGRAQGLFTPSTSQHQGLVYPPPPGVVYPGSPGPVVPGVSPTPPPIQSLKRTRSEMDAGSAGFPDTIHSLMTAQGSVQQAVQVLLLCLTLMQQISLGRPLQRQLHQSTMTTTRPPRNVLAQSRLLLGKHA